MAQLKLEYFFFKSIFSLQLPIEDLTNASGQKSIASNNINNHATNYQEVFTISEFINIPKIVHFELVASFR